MMTASENNDLIVLLSKCDVPVKNTEAENEYFCLGHFDYAKFEKSKNRIENLNSFYNRNNEYLKKDESKDKSGFQLNYLINSGYSGGETDDNYNFRFVMMISVDKKSDELDKYKNEKVKKLAEEIHGYYEKLISKPDKQFGSLRWMIYYPISRGDVAVIIDSKFLKETVDLIFEFVKKFEPMILHSYTITMIKNKNESCFDGDGKFNIAIRAIVKNYKKFEDILMQKEARLKGNLSKEAKYLGEVDVRYDFKGIKEKQLIGFLQYISKETTQKILRNDAVFSFETDVYTEVQNGNNTTRSSE